MSYTEVPTNEDFILAEDAALKTLLEGLQLDAPREGGGQIDVGVWFRWPQREYNDAIFPFITIDLLDVQLEPDRAHSYAYDWMTYVSDSLPDDTATPQSYLAPYPIPFMLVYLVAAHCRSAQHDRRLYSRLLANDLLPRRYGQLFVPKDNTVRRLEVLDIAESNDYDSLKKRVFRRMFTIGVSAEMLPEKAVIYSHSIQSVKFDQMQSLTDMGLDPPAFHIEID